MHEKKINTIGVSTVCVGHGKREKKTFKHCIRKEKPKKRWLGHILRAESFLKEVV